MKTKNNLILDIENVEQKQKMMRKRGRGEKGGKRGRYIMTNKIMQITAIYQILAQSRCYFRHFYTGNFSLHINADGACS